MENKIKLIWDFRGPAAEKTAEHHEIHLKDFLLSYQMENVLSGCEKLNDFHFTAFIVVEKKEMIFFRDRLKPNRGQVYNG